MGVPKWNPASKLRCPRRGRALEKCDWLHPTMEWRRTAITRIRAVWPGELPINIEPGTAGVWDYQSTLSLFYLFLPFFANFNRHLLMNLHSIPTSSHFTRACCLNINSTIPCLLRSSSRYHYGCSGNAALLLCLKRLSLLPFNHYSPSFFSQLLIPHFGLLNACMSMREYHEYLRCRLCTKWHARAVGERGEWRWD